MEEDLKNDSDAIKELNPLPANELAFWQDRMNNFMDIENQLKDCKVGVMMNIFMYIENQLKDCKVGMMIYIYFITNFVIFKFR